MKQKKRARLWKKSPEIKGWCSPFKKTQHIDFECEKPKHPWVGLRFRPKDAKKAFKIKKIAITPFGHLIVDPKSSKIAYSPNEGFFVLQ